MGTGQWDGNKLVFTADVDMGQNKMHFRETYSDITANSFTFTMETATGDAPMAKMLTIQYERVQPKTVETPPSTTTTPPADTTTPKPQ
jgi:hypothetical protein